MFGYKNIKYNELNGYSSFSECTEQLLSKNSISFAMPFPNQKNNKDSKFNINKNDIQLTLDTNIYTLTNKNYPDYYLIIKNKQSNCGFKYNYILPKLYIDILEKMDIDFNSVRLNFALSHANENILIILVEKLTPIFNVRLNDSIKNNLIDCADKGWFPTIDSFNDVYINSKNEIRIINFKEYKEFNKPYYTYLINNCNTEGEVVQNTENLNNEGGSTYLNYLFEFFNERNCSNVMKCQDNICSLIAKIEEEPKEPNEEDKKNETGPKTEEEDKKNETEEDKKNETGPKTEEEEDKKNETGPKTEEGNKATSPEPQTIDKEELKNEVIEYVNEYISQNGKYDEDKTKLNDLIKKYRESLKSRKFNLFSTDPAKKISKSLEMWNKNQCSIILLRTLVESIDNADKSLENLLNEKEVELFKSECKFKSITMKMYTDEDAINNIKNKCENGFDSSCKKILNKLDNLIIKIEEEPVVAEKKE